MKSLKLAGLLLSLVMMTACPKDPYNAALKGSADVADSVHSAIAIESDLYKQSVIDKPEKDIAAGYLRLVTDGNTAFRGCVVTAHAAASKPENYLACANVFVEAVGKEDPAAFHFKNAQAQAKLQTYLQAVKTAINGISLAIQNAKGGQ